jgi:polysaccharide export outer membrane protein
MPNTRGAGRRALAAGLVWLVLPGLALAQAAPYQLVPMTKLKLTIVQFMPASGDYKRWDALSGDLEVAEDGTVLVPALGAIPVGTSTPDELAATIADRLQAKLGLVGKPDATVQVVDYPPIYLIGSITTPGQYAFRPGMTVLQAVALGGGDFRADGRADPADTIRLQSDLQGIDTDTLRTTARVARLEAELSDADTIAFPAELNSSDPDVAQIIKQEQVIFAARHNELTRQLSALDDLTALYHAELDALDEKAKSIDDQAKIAQQQLDGVKDLVGKGIATVSRQTDLERSVAGLRSDRLDNIIATMNARQGLNQALRDRAKLEDDRRSEVSMQLQTEQAALAKLRLNEATTSRLLRQSMAFDADVTRQQAPRDHAYTILRTTDGHSTEIAATESTALLPGDLLKVTTVLSAPPSSASAAALP